MTEQTEDLPLAPRAAPPAPPPAPSQFARRLFRALARDNPFYLLNLFNTLLAGSFVLILAAAGTAIYMINSSSLLRGAEVTAVSVGRAILSAEVDNLLQENSDGSLRLAIQPDTMRAVDAQMRRYLKFFNMARIVIFNSDRRVVYSTQPGLIGSVEGSKELQFSIMRGLPISEIVDREKVASETGAAVDGDVYVESYFPVMDVRGTPLGAFEVYVDISSTAAEIQHAITWSLEVLAAILAICLFSLYRPMKHGTLRLISAHRELRELAARDHLTGAYNRRYIADRVRQEFVRWNRHAATPTGADGICFVMGDIDHFKRINDTYGHATGDEVLREVAHRIGEGLRPYDMLGRYGGEEFLAMLPNTSMDEAIHIAERLRWAVGEHHIGLADGTELKVTMSFGVASAAPHEESEQEVIRRADRALYRAKAEGRNRVVANRSGE